MTTSGVQKFMRQVAKIAPRSDEAYYVKNGKLFSNEPLRSEDVRTLERLLSRVHAFKVGECYMNAAKIALEHRNLKFCEGFAAGFYPVPHAWNTYKGRPIDVTWPLKWDPRSAYYKPTEDGIEIMKRVNFNVTNCSYVGIVVEQEDLRDHLLQMRAYGPTQSMIARYIRERTRKALTGT